ncbi:mediator complex subunit 27-domain-containing protein [Gongronella butleri]|nr:mediator complex subunit 27-domain-containing protein [Gongronella butleri]
MAAPKSQQEIEQAISHIDHTLTTVCEIRSSLRQFVKTVETNPQQPSYIHQFSDGLNKVKRELNRLTGETDSLKGVLEYAHVLAQQNNFDWPAIKEVMENEQGAVPAASSSDKKSEREIGHQIKSKVDDMLSELSSVVLPKQPSAPAAADTMFITNVLDQWLASDKLKAIHIQHNFPEPEHAILHGSTCSLEKSYWQESGYKVLRKMHMVASRALDDLTRLAAREALVSVLDWLASYHRLYQTPCARCHKILQFDSPQFKHLPPVVRTWDQTIGTAYHLKCFQE